MVDIVSLKCAQLEQVAAYRDRLRKSPRMEWLFFEITDRCNLNCRHCGSSCRAEGRALSAEDVKRVLRSLNGENPTICLTGGEPMLHPGFFEIAQCVRDAGFFWGMTTNATLIDAKAAARLKDAGLSTVSVSLDGMEASHDALRRQEGAWQKAVKGIKALQDAGLEPQVSTVVHRDNIHELEELYEFLIEKGIMSWRAINIEPIGRACAEEGLMLSPEQFAYLLSYIKEKRFDRNCSMEVTFGCSHYLGLENERMVRDHYFLCGAGILTAGVRCNGDICACLDVENRKELVQGNIRTDDFWEVWQNKFQAFRRDRTADCTRCVECEERLCCGGDSAHTWDFAKKELLLYCRDIRQ